MSKKNYRSRLAIIFIFYKIVVEVNYAQGIGSHFSYTGIEIQFDFIKYLCSWLMMVVIIICSNYMTRNCYISIVNTILIFFSYIPTIALWGIKDGITFGAIFATSIYCLSMNTVGCIFTSITKKWFPNGNMDYIIDKYENKESQSIIILISILCLVIMIVCHQIVAPDRWSLSLSESLSARLEIREAYIPSIIKYMYMIIGGAMAPAMFSFGLKMKNKWLILCNLAVSYLAYTINGMKTYILIYAVIIFFYFLSKRSNKIFYFQVRLGEALIAAWSFSLIVWKTNGSYILISYLHRLFTVPAEIHYYYYDFFRSNEFLFLRDSIGRFFAESPYSPSASRVIGSLYYHNNYTNATNGMFSDFYANFGYIGLIIYPFLVFFAMVLLEKQIKAQGSFLTLSIIFISLIVLINNTFFTWLITGGYVFNVVLMYVINKIRIKSIGRRKQCTII